MSPRNDSAVRREVAPIIWWPKGAKLKRIRELKLDPKNPRTHSPEQIAALARGIQEFGFTTRIIVDAKNRVLAGHARIAAAKVLGMTEVPVDVVEHLTEAQRTAYVIADNKLALMSGWDPVRLGESIAKLSEGGFDVTLLAFSDEEMQRVADDAQRAYLQATAGGAGPEDTGDEGYDEDGDDEEDGEDDTDAEVPFTVLMSTEDRAKVYAALKYVKERDNINRADAALLKIIDEWRAM